MAKKDRIDLFLEDLPDKVADATDRIKLNEVADVAFKGGVWVSCVMGVKFLTDLVLDDELLKWAGENPRMLDTMLKSYVTLSVTGGFWPADIQRIFRDYMDDPLTEKEIDSLVDSYQNQGFFANKRVPFTNPLLLVKITLMDHAKLKAIMEARVNRAEETASQANMIQRQIDILEADILLLLEQGKKAGIEGRERKIEELKAALAEAEKAAQLELDAKQQHEEAVAKSINILRWSIALVIGTYMAGCMVYAGDTLLDTAKDVFSMFKLPFRGGI